MFIVDSDDSSQPSCLEDLDLSTAIASSYDDRNGERYPWPLFPTSKCLKSPLNPVLLASEQSEDAIQATSSQLIPSFCNAEVPFLPDAQRQLLPLEQETKAETKPAIDAEWLSHTMPAIKPVMKSLIKPEVKPELKPEFGDGDRVELTGIRLGAASRLYRPIPEALQRIMHDVQSDDVRVLAHLGLKTVLKQHQKEAVIFALNRAVYDMSTAIFDSMGLGKTVETLVKAPKQNLIFDTKHQTLNTRRPLYAAFEVGTTQICHS